MAGEVCGVAVIVQMEDDAEPPAFHTVAGLKTRSISIASEIVDVTNADSPGRWREILANCGTKSCTINGEGVFKDNTAAEKVRAAKFAGAVRNWKFTIPGFGTITMPGKISTLEYSADHTDAVSNSFGVESAGEVAWTAG